MIGTKLHGISSGTLYSFFPRNKRLKISKQGLNFINTKNTLNKNSLNNKEFNNIDNESFNINGLTFMSQSQKDAVLNEMTSGEQWAKSTGAALNALGGEDAIDRVSGSNDAVKQAVSNFANSPELHANADAAVMGALKINPDEIKQQAQQAQANAIKGAIKESQDAQLKREINANLSGLSAEEKSKLFYNNPKQAGESNEDYMYRVSRDYRDGKAK
jgi:hypothetical protein